MLLEFERLRDHFDSPVLDLSMLSSFEAKEKVAGVFGVDTEVVHGALRIGFRVGG